MSGETKKIQDGEGIGRRQFLQVAGFSVGAAALAGCGRPPEEGVMPYLVRPEEVTPGKPYWYASVCGACAAGCGILAKDRDGRPIKLEGNDDHPLSRGGLCASGQASVISLYDSRRLRRPLRGKQESTWEAVDGEIGAVLASLPAAGARVRFLTDSVTGPAERDRIAAFLSRFGDGRHVIYDPLSASAIAQAHRQTHGLRRVPRYRLDRAHVIAGFGADFLGTWISPVEHAAAYRKGRKVSDDGKRFSHHEQFESRLSLTGSKADRRTAVPPGSMAQLLAHLAGELATRRGVPVPWTSLPECPTDPGRITALADRLWKAARGRTLVLCGENDLEAQCLTNFVNELLGNYGGESGRGTLDLEASSLQRLGNDEEMKALLAELEAGRVDALFIRGVNPVYDLPGGEKTAAALSRVKLVVALAGADDETAGHAHFVCPEPHFLESWGDTEPVAGLAALRQPAIRRMGLTRPLLESLAVWSAEPAAPLDILRAFWRREIYPRRRAKGSTFEQFWNGALHDGYVSLARPTAPARPAFADGAVQAPLAGAAAAAGELLLDLHPSAAFMDGRHAHNPWLHELPDPIAKTVWDNFAAISGATAAELGITGGDVVRISSVDGEEASLELPALVQPGQHSRTLAVALGYGRAGTQRFAEVGPQWWEGRPTVEDGHLVGVNAAPLLAWKGGGLSYGGRRVKLQKTGARHELATTQIYHSLSVPEHLAGGHEEPRPIVQETTLAAWRKDPASGGHGHHELPSLWPVHPMPTHHWGMAIDLTACTGCSACVISCQAENNIPVVGKDEVRRAREMHWLRIDRYYSGEGEDVDVAHMPMMCQHCDNAPCETVCPVQATAQSAEGLNQQIYNRCVGTRYCANNCPYKVRRFNWFTYPREDRLQNLALNPDVTVRSRGVMEKCSMCIQRIQDGKVEAKRTGRPLQDGDIRPACAQSCPSQAIVFGDMNDPESKLARQKHDPRHYHVLAELGVKPVVGYLTLVRNREEG